MTGDSRSNAARLIVQERLSIILPTKGRAEQCKRLVEKLWETTRGHDIEVIIIAYPDTEAKIVFNQEFELIYDFTKVVFDDCRGIEAYQKGSKLATGKYLFPCQDDIWPEDDLWLDKVFEVIDTVPNGYGYFKIPTDSHDYWAECAVMDRQMAKDIFGGVITIPAYHSQYIDVELSDRAMAAGVFYTTKTKFAHNHWSTGKAKVDDTYKNGGCTSWQRDYQKYNERKAAGFPNDYEDVL